MAAEIKGVFEDNLEQLIKEATIFVIGAGGIGCELLKNLVLTGFKNIYIIDMDTIDVSNLNRQFLFQKKHVGRSKAIVAKESVLKFNPHVNIMARHDSIISAEYGVNFFKQFNVVLNALDNRAARNHVNRMCLAADVPLIESGTAGYDGQVELIVKEKTKCYECDPKAPQKTFPGCTIRNTPSEPVHCIVWAKHLFNQLFGEDDPDEDVSPDTADPEATGDAADGALNSETTEEGNVKRVSTRNWALSCSYDPEKLFTKLFCDDIKYLLSMDNLWKKRKPPTPLDWNNLPDAVPGSSKEPEILLRDQRTWSIAECARVFAGSCTGLKEKFMKLKEGDHLVWDKDDRDSMDFVAACANIRAHAFGIPLKSRFDIKSMAGNIIPAIATTNAIIAGLVVLHTLKVLQEQFEKCQSVYLRLRPNHRGLLVVPEKVLNPPNPNCYVCAPKPSVHLYVNPEKMITVEVFQEVILKKNLNMTAPDVFLNSTGNIIISSEEGETDHNLHKRLDEVGITDGSVLVVDDFLQEYTLMVIINYKDDIKDGQEFEIVAGADVKPKEEEEKQKNGEKEDDIEEDDDDMMIIEEAEIEEPVPPKKRKLDDTSIPVKKRRTNGDSTSFETGDANEPIVI